MDIPKGYVRLPGSFLGPVEGFVRSREAIAPDRQIDVTVRVRRNPKAPPLEAPPPRAKRPKNYVLPTREEFASLYGAARDELELVAAFFAKKYGLTVVEKDESAASSTAVRAVTLRGTVEAYRQAFGVSVDIYERQSSRGQDGYLGREGWIHVPADLQHIVVGVFGLDQRPIGFRDTPIRFLSAAGLPTPPQMASHYKFPGTNAAGQCIALMEFGGGFFQADIDKYFTDNGFPKPTIHLVGIDGQTNTPGTAGLEQFDREVTLDIDIAGSAAPGATIAVYFAPHTEAGWVNGLKACVHDTIRRPSVISISWGAAELQGSNTLVWSQSAMKDMNDTFVEAAGLGITVLAASGDYGSDCRVGNRRAHIAYPASDPHVIACGGTSIATFIQPYSETPWSRSGGGISRVFDAPAYQADNVTLPSSVNSGEVRRGVPDVSGYASPGYSFFYKMQPFVPQGTSLTAPLYAALVARLNAQIGTPLGFINPDLYALAGTGVFRDMTGGTSNSYAWSPGYHSVSEWDAITGLGVIDGQALLAKL